MRRLPRAAAWLVCGVAWASGCGGGSFYGDLPLGWRGSVPTCARATVASGSSVVRLDTGFLDAVAPGRATLTCGDGSETDIRIREVKRLTIEGPAHIEVGAVAGYYLKAYAADGDELRWASPFIEAVQWSSSVAAPDMHVEGAYCHEPLFSCPDIDYARLFTQRAGTVTLMATFRGQSATRQVTVDER
jgi:hypothetical protein